MLFNPDTNREFTKEINYYFLEQLIPVAEKHGIKLALENMPGNGVPVSTPGWLMEYINMMNPYTLFSCLDTGHANISGGNIAEFAKKLGNKLAVLHLHDNCGKNDEHFLPFLGTIKNWAEFMKTLKEINYTGTLNLEAETFITKLPTELQHDGCVMSFGILQHLLMLME